MANLSPSLRHVKSHLDQLVPEDQILQLCRQIKHNWRDRVLNPALTVQLFLLQLLSKVALEGLRHVAAVSVSAQAICQAKMRLPLQLLIELVGRSVPNKVGESRWRGLVVYLADGMSFLIPDKPALAKRFGRASNQRGASNSYPVPKLLALMDLAGGYIQKVITLPAHRQEFTCLSRLFAAVGKDALLLGDRGLVSFAHLALMCIMRIQGCFRLPHWQVAFGRGRRTRRIIAHLGKQDVLVRWTASQRPAWLSVKRWLPLARMELTLRQISYRVHRPGFRVQWAWIITTLTDAQKYPAPELIALYDKRWQIEVYFRDLKRTLGMHMIAAQTVEGVRKEILAFVLLYNLIRRVMGQAAAQQQVAADRVSFVDALRWLLYASPGDAIPRLKVNPNRRRPSPPRQIKCGRHRFPQLNESRGSLCKPPCQVKL
jgi:DDE family transposase